MSARNGHSGNVRSEKVTVDLVAEGFDNPDLPNSIDVQLDADANNHHVATIDDADAGRWSVDFSVSMPSIELTRAYREGTHVPLDDLPAWFAPVREAIEEAMLR